MKNFMIVCKCDDTINVIVSKTKLNKYELYKQFDLLFDEYDELHIYFDNLYDRMDSLQRMVKHGHINLIDQTIFKNYAQYICEL